MRDRVPTKPNRYAVYDDSHNFIRYEYHERADEPTEGGTPINKANLLKDATAALFGLANTAVPDDVLALLAGRAKIATGSYTGTGTYGSGNKNTISYDIKPEIIVVHRVDGWLGLFFKDSTRAMVFQISNTNTTANSYFGLVATWGDTSIQWYSDGGVSQQLNFNGTTYYYSMIYKGE